MVTSIMCQSSWGGLCWFSVFVQRRSSDSSDEEILFGEFCIKPQSERKWISTVHPVIITANKATPMQHLKVSSSLALMGRQFKSLLNGLLPPVLLFFPIKVSWYSCVCVYTLCVMWCGITGLISVDLPEEADLIQTSTVGFIIMVESIVNHWMLSDPEECVCDLWG